MGDYPDYTSLMQIVGTDIMIPIDIQGAYIMMPVDLQAQYITLEIDIVAQSVGNIAIDLVAQSVGNIQVNIAAQTVENLTIDINAQHVGIYSMPEWAAKEQDDVDEYDGATVLASGIEHVMTYAVPENKVLFVCQWGGFNLEADVGIWGRLKKYNGATLTKSVSGGHVGFSVVEHKPIRFVYGEEARVELYNFHTESCTMYGGINGYLVDV